MVCLAHLFLVLGKENKTSDSNQDLPLKHSGRSQNGKTHKRQRDESLAKVRLKFCFVKKKISFHSPKGLSAAPAAAKSLQLCPTP